MELSEVARHRVRAHHLEPADQPSAAAVVRGLLAMQAQDYRGGLWSVGVRTAHLTEADVELALRNREIVRTWPMRGTIHLVAADDVRWLSALLGPRASQAAAGRRRGLGLDDASVATVRAAWEAALAGGTCLGRPELFKAMDAAGVDSGDQRGPHLLRYFAEQGVLCFGPHAGRQATYMLIEESFPPARTLSREEALAELALRYFRSHGPATLDDLVGWAMITKTDARAGLAAVAGELEKAVIDGVDYWMSPALRDALRAPQGPRSAQLLAGFDEFVLGYKNRTAFMTPEISRATVPGGNGMFKATILNHGQVVGLWSLKRLSRKQVITPTWFAGRRKPSATALTRAVARYAAFSGVETEPA